MAKPGVEAVIAAARAGWSDVERYFWDHYEVLAKDLNAYGANWKAIAALFEKQGMRDAGGNPPSTKTLMRAWARTVQRKTGDKVARRKSPSINLKKKFSENC